MRIQSLLRQQRKFILNDISLNKEQREELKKELKKIDKRLKDL